ncbi:MAG: NAD(P)-dependent alcohol dehydrogenase [Cyclobacteriaceae bacterium]|nr:NAD(P)-dependent alcohol dehydrogenase [Cyclobacteriaceae bacterium]
MKAVVYERYGPPEVLELRDIPKPVPKPNEVLVKVRATTVTAGDWRMRSAKPFLARLFNGLFKPTRVKVLGFEVSGVIEEVGSDVTRFKVGDEVFAGCGFQFGGYAEYKCLPVNDMIAHKPSNVTFEEAAAVPVGGLTALRLFDQTGLKASDSVLIYGASGSVGTYAIQIARDKGAEVTAVCSTANAGLVRSLGADHVVDYTKEDVTKLEARYDVIIDAVGKISKSAGKKLLKPGGNYATVASSTKAAPNEMLTLKTMMEAGTLKAVIDRRYTLEQIREAHAYVESFRKKGNVVVNVS